MFKKAYTFDDVLLVPRYSEVLPRDVDLKTKVTRGIELNSPILSAAMDTVTEGRMAITMALSGGMGIIHKNMTMERQAEEIVKVKEFVITEDNVGASVDSKNRLIVGAALSTSEDKVERITKLVEAGVDVLVIDTAHGHSKKVIKTVEWAKNEFPEIQIIAGNIATAEGTIALIDAGADAVKVGIGPGSICTTRVVSGVGYPQLSAIMNCYSVARDRKVPIIADGGIRYSGDIVKALAAGASAVMLGNMLAGTEETPGETFESNGEKVKRYRGMGSIGAMKAGSSDRYFQDGISVQKLVPEGVEATVKYRGPAEQIVFQLLGGLRSGMGYCGAENLKVLRDKAVFVEVTPAGVVESHPHDLII